MSAAGTSTATPPHIKRDDYIGWHSYFMGIARISKYRSEVDDIQNGACIINTDKRIVGVGYNTLISPLVSAEQDNEIKKLKYSDQVCHAAINAVANRNTSNLRDCKIYLTSFPCNECSKMIVQAGITQIIYDGNLDKEDKQYQASKKMFDIAAVDYKEYSLATKSEGENRLLKLILNTSESTGKIDAQQKSEQEGCYNGQSEELTKTEYNCELNFPKYRVEFRNKPNEIFVEERDNKDLGTDIYNLSYFTAIAIISGMRSKDPKTQVGACIVNSDNIIVSAGYNGFARRCSDNIMSWATDGDENKHLYVCHAELNAFLNRNDKDLKGCKIYQTLFPCYNCTKFIVTSGIEDIIFTREKPAKNLDEAMAAYSMLKKRIEVKLLKNAELEKHELKFENILIKNE